MVRNAIIGQSGVAFYGQTAEIKNLLKQYLPDDQTYADTGLYKTVVSHSFGTPK